MFDPKNEASARFYAGQWLTLAGPNLRSYASGDRYSEIPAVRKAAVNELCEVVEYLNWCTDVAKYNNVHSDAYGEQKSREIAGLEALIAHIRDL